jgi:general secretion pathway protein F
LTNFHFKCVEASGKKTKGVIAAPDGGSARSLLRERGLTIIDIAESRSGTKRTLGRGKRITGDDVYNFAKEMTILLHSGIQIDKAISILIGSSANPRMREVFETILKEIKLGKNLHEAFAEARIFNPLVIAMLNAGESIGNLGSAFANIAEHMKFQIQFKGEIRNAMTYPLFLLSASFITLFVIFKFIIPRFFSIFNQADMQLPIMAKILYAIGDYLNVTMACVAGGVIVGAVLAYRRGIRKEAVARAVYSGLFLVPFLRKLILYLEFSRFSYSMYSMLNSGVEFINALILSVEVVQHRQIRSAIKPTVSQIKGGKGIADSFSNVGLLPELMLSMVRVGEESGNLKEIFFELHQVFDERFKNSTKRALALIEPCVIVITGMIVGFIVISLILTVMSAGNIKL